MFTVAEFVENAADAAYLTEIGVDCLQGYYFAAPTVQKPWQRPEGVAQVPDRVFGGGAPVDACRGIPAVAAVRQIGYARSEPGRGDTEHLGSVPHIPDPSKGRGPRP